MATAKDVMKMMTDNEVLFVDLAGRDNLPRWVHYTAAAEQLIASLLAHH